MITMQMQRTGLSHAETTIFNLNNRDYYLMRLPKSLIVRNVMFFFVCASHGGNSVTPIVGMIPLGNQIFLNVSMVIYKFDNT